MSVFLAFERNTDTLFSMALEALSTIRSSLARWKPLDLSPPRVLPLGISALDAALPEGGVALGGITELQVRGASGAATSFALAACRAAQQRGREQHGSPQHGSPQHGSPQISPQLEDGAWCAFIDPSASLFAPGMARLGVDLSRLLVARPAPEAIDRVAVRIAEANLMAMLVIDLRCSVQSSSLNEHSWQHSWQRAVRRLSLAIKSSLTSVLLITHAEQFRSLPLPAFQRLELARRSQTTFELKVAKERTGRVSAARPFSCSIFDLCNFVPSNVVPSNFVPSNFVPRTNDPSNIHTSIESSVDASRRIIDCKDTADIERSWQPAMATLTRKVS